MVVDTSPQNSSWLAGLAEAGWYPDPADQRSVRWWNGTQWEDRVRAAQAEPERVAGLRGGWIWFGGLVAAVFASAVGSLIGLVVDGLPAACQGSTDALSSPDCSTALAGASGVLFGSLAGLWAAMLGACVWASRRNGTRSLLRDAGLVTISGRAVLLAAGIALGARVVSLVTSALMAVFVGGVDDVEQVSFADQPNVVATIALALAVSVGAPVVEELFFRGLLFGTLLARTRVWVAVVVQAVAFTIVHLAVPTGAAAAVIAAGILPVGVLLGVVRLRRSMTEAILVHGFFNASAVALLLLTT